jgi:GNAT superfamily N-acetyltransferase
VGNLPSREARASDAGSILAVGVARDVADLGAPDWTLADVRDEMAAADRAWVVEDERGEVVAAALLASGDARVLVHPDACGQGIGTHLRELVEQAAVPGTLLMQPVHGSNDVARSLLVAAGYEATQHYWRMGMTLDHGLPASAWPPGITPRGYAGGHELAVHALVEEAFSEIPGNVPEAFEQWRANSVGRAHFAPDLSTLAFASDGSLAGAALCERWDGDEGFVAYLATARTWRGRGLGRALLVDALVGMRAAGLVRAALAVNGRNRSATALYESVGMTVESHADRYDKQMP